jgi:transducin (beta)-like 1
LEARLQAEQQNAAAALSTQLSVNGALSNLSGGIDDPLAASRQALAAQAVTAAAAQAALGLSQFQMGNAAAVAGAPGTATHPGLTQPYAADILALQQQYGNVSTAPALANTLTAAQIDAVAGSGKRSSAGAPKKSSKKQKKENAERTKETTTKTSKTAEAAKPMEIDQGDGAPTRPKEDSQLMVNGQKEHGAASNDVNGDQKAATSTTTDGEQVVEESNVPDEEILRLEMHQSEVFMCAWNPVFTYLIATGSGDASARIWHMRGNKAKDGLNTVKLLPHGTDPRDRKNKDVTTLEWSPDGMSLATGSYDGVARVWARSGALIHTLRGHNGPIFSLKWNKRGNYLLSGSYDKTTIVWDVSGSTGFIEQQFTDHEAPALDVDWKDNTTFASCSTDKTVHICKVGSAAPLKIYSGHQDEVNGVKWDPSGKLLASCSDDCTAKVWDVESDRTTPLYDFKSHQQEIYTVKWSPTGPGSNYPEKKAMLATASFDGSVRLWDVSDGSCYRIFNRHQDSVYSVAFSPSGDFLASGSLAGQLYIWNIEEGKHIKSYKGRGDIFEVAWNKEETRVAACFSSNVVTVIDFERPGTTT